MAHSKQNMHKYLMVTSVVSIAILCSSSHTGSHVSLKFFVCQKCSIWAQWSFVNTSYYYQIPTLLYLKLCITGSSLLWFPSLTSLSIMESFLASSHPCGLHAFIVIYASQESIFLITLSLLSWHLHCSSCMFYNLSAKSVLERVSCLILTLSPV